MKKDNFFSYLLIGLIGIILLVSAIQAVQISAMKADFASGSPSVTIPVSQVQAQPARASPQQSAGMVGGC
jgi:hypothetical protein